MATAALRRAAALAAARSACPRPILSTTAAAPKVARGGRSARAILSPRPLAGVRGAVRFNTFTVACRVRGVTTYSSNDAGGKGSHMEREKEIAELQRHLSMAFAEQDLEAAREIAQRLRDQTKDLYGDSHPVYASALNNMGLVSKSAGDFDEAMNLYTVAVQIYEKTVGKTHPSTITSLRNLGLTYKAMLDTKTVTGVEALHVQESAAEALQDCLQRRLETMEEGHPEIASAMYTLAAVRRYQNQNEEALRLIHESISMLQEWYGEGSTHPVLATAINNLGYHHKVCGELDLAFEPYSEALGMRVQALGEKHPDTIASMNNLAELHLARGDTEKATVIQERILAILTSEKER